jgi:hypothetical protein
LPRRLPVRFSTALPHNVGLWLLSEQASRARRLGRELGVNPPRSSIALAGGDGAELFEFAEEVLDQVARLAEVAVEIAAGATMCARRESSAVLVASLMPLAAR